jgi:hypothetical protein
LTYKTLREAFKRKGDFQQDNFDLMMKEIGLSPATPVPFDVDPVLQSLEELPPLKK